MIHAAYACLRRGHGHIRSAGNSTPSAMLISEALYNSLYDIWICSGYRAWPVLRWERTLDVMPMILGSSLGERNSDQLDVLFFSCLRYGRMVFNSLGRCKTKWQNHCEARIWLLIRWLIARGNRRLKTSKMTLRKITRSVEEAFNLIILKPRKELCTRTESRI